MSRPYAAKFIPDSADADRKWVDIGGDLEASYDGKRYVDIRSKADRRPVLFLSRGAFYNCLALFNPQSLCD